MPGDNYKRVHSGERLQIPAAAWNDLLGMLSEWKRGGFAQRAGGPELSKAPVKVRNATGAALGQFAVVKINGVTIDPDDNEEGFRRQVCLEGATADAADNIVAILQRAAADGEVVPAVMTGESVALVNVSSAAHQYAAPANGETVLVSQADAGPWRILWANGTGNGTWCVVRSERLGAVVDGAVNVLVSPTPPLHVSTVGDDVTVSIDEASCSANIPPTQERPGYVTSDPQQWGGYKISVHGPNESTQFDMIGNYPPGFYGRWPATGEGDYYATAGVFPVHGNALAGQGKAGKGAALWYDGPEGNTYLLLDHLDGDITAVLVSSADIYPAFGVQRLGTMLRGIDGGRTLQGAGVDAGLRITQRFVGGLLVGETVAAGASGTGSGTASILGCCSDTALPDTLTLTLPDTSEVSLEYNQGNSWIGGDYTMGCWDLGSGLQWYLTDGLTTVAADDGGSCDPFSQTFTLGGDIYEVTE